MSTKNSPSSHKRAGVSWISTVLADSAFLIIWAAVQWLVARVLEAYPVEGLEVWVLIVLRVAFAISTLAPIILWIYADIGVMFYQSRAAVSRAKKEYEESR